MRYNLAAFLFGLIFLSLEMLCFKVLDFSAGAYSFVGPVTVAGFLIFSGIGSLVNSRVRNYRFISFLFFLIVFILSFSLKHLPSIFGFFVSKYPEHSFLIGIIQSCLLLLPIGFFIGLYFPMLIKKGSSLKSVFVLESIGALTGIVLFEFFLYTKLGLQSTGFLISGLILLLGFLLKDKIKVEKEISFNVFNKMLILGIFTGGFQSLWLVMINYFLGPFYFSKSLVVFSFILGITLGSSFLIRVFSLKTLMLMLSISMSITFYAIKNYLFTLANFNFYMTLAMLLGLILLSSVFIGAILPQYLIENKVKERRDIGRFNFSLLVGNFVGLIGVFVLTGFFNEYQILLGIILGLLIVNYKYFYIPHIAITLFSVYGFTHVDFNNLVKITSPNKKITRVDKTFRSFGTFSAVYSFPGFNFQAQPSIQRRLYQNGYSPIDIDQGHETFIGIVGTSYAKEHKNALVLGSGSGRSAGSISLTFDNVDLVDIDLNTMDLMDYLKQENYYLKDFKGFGFFNIDAVLAPFVLKKKYDLIILTVDPGYHSLASKLYTVEYFNNLKDMLTPDGVFIFWLDYTLEQDNEHLLMNTAKEVFPYQRGYGIYKEEEKPTYYLVVNSQKPIKYKIPLDLYFEVRNNTEFLNFDLLTDDKYSFEIKPKTKEVNTWYKNKINKFKRMNFQWADLAEEQPQ